MLGPLPHVGMEALERSCFKDEVSDTELFAVKDHNYSQQYANMYFSRLSVLRNQVLKASESKWSGKARFVPKVLDVAGPDLSFIVGTIYCEFGNKPNILNEVTTDQWMSFDHSEASYRDSDPEKNQILLEDESGRILLVGDTVKDSILVTGVVVGVLGREVAGGAFEVAELCYPMPQSTQVPLSELPIQQDTVPVKNQPKWIALLSDLALGSDGDDVAVQMCFDYLAGDLDPQGTVAISKLIVAGNSLALKMETDKEREAARWARSRPDVATNDLFLSPVQNLDTLIASVASTLSVDVLSGQSDPSTQRMPQDPLPRGLFSLSRQFSAFKTVSNPYKCSINGLVVVCDSGQPLSDICKYEPNSSPLKLAESIHLWQHLAPTCPDTLWCYPFKMSDPFIMSESPHVHVIGCQKAFQTSEYIHPETGAKTRIILVPSFKRTKQLVLLNSQTLETRVVDFS